MTNEMPVVGRLVGGVQRLMQQQSEGQGTAPGADSTTGMHDAGWVELLSRDATLRYGRGHLMLWASVRPEVSADAPTRIETDAAFPVGEDAPGLRGELRSFSADGEAFPPDGGPFSVRPEQEGGTIYPVVVQGPVDVQASGTLPLRWMDGELPSSLRELGGL